MVQVTPVLATPSLAGSNHRSPAAILPLDGPQNNLVAPITGPKAANTVVFGRVSFAITLTAIHSLHAICVAYLITAGRVYEVLPSTNLCLNLQLYQLVLDPSWFPTIAAVHYALASIHVFVLIKPYVTAALRAMVATSTGMRISRSLNTLTRSFGSGAIIRQRSWSSRMCCTPQHFQLFGVHSAHFDLLFLAREFVETVLQTYQAYTMTRLLPRENLNGLYTLLLIVNCWATPLLKPLCRRNKSLERLLAVLCDIVLDFVSSIGVPVTVAIGYLEQYDPAATDFVPYTIYYNDVWLLNFMNETPIVIFGSWFDAASRMIFSLGLLLSLNDAKALVARHPRTLQVNGPSTTAVLIRRKSSRAKSQKASMIQKLKEPNVQARVSTWVHRLMILWGIGVAIMYLEASVRAPPLHCSLPLRPWLVADPACAVVTIDCLKDPSLSGDAADFEAVYSNLDAGSVEYVIFRHCPKVEFTPRFLTFSNLYGVKIYNSTIESWKLDAAVTGTAHPRLRFAFLLLTHFPGATLPLGLQHEQFPLTLLDVEISVSNLERIPPTLPWPPYMTIFIEYSQLNEFPMVLARIKPFTLVLGFNNITTIPAEALMAPDIGVFDFAGNPIQALPETGVDITQLYDTESNVRLYWISLPYSNVTTLPAWVTEQYVDQVEIRAAQSPICLQILQNASSPEREILLRERPWLSKVEELCGHDIGKHGWYPIEVDAADSDDPE